MRETFRRHLKRRSAPEDVSFTSCTPGKLADTFSLDQVSQLWNSRLSRHVTKKTLSTHQPVLPTETSKPRTRPQTRKSSSHLPRQLRTTGK